MGLRSGLRVEASQVLSHGVIVMLKQEKAFHKLVSHRIIVLFEISLYAVALNENKGPSPNHRIQPRTKSTKSCVDRAI